MIVNYAIYCGPNLVEYLDNEEEAISLAQSWQREVEEEQCYVVIAHQDDGKMRRMWPDPEWDYR